jgi:hypothetical protein
MQDILFFLMRLGFTFLALLILKIVELGQRAYNSHNVIDMPLHAVKIGIRVATSWIFNETINAQRYQTLLLKRFIINQGNDAEVTNYDFQQDSASAHTAGTIIKYLRVLPDWSIIVGLWPIAWLDFSW